MSQPCFLCQSLKSPICPSTPQEKFTESIRITVSFAYAHHALLEKTAEKRGMHVNRLIRACALENSTSLDEKIKGTWLTLAFHKQIRLSFYPNQLRKLEREAERLQVSVQELIRMSTSLA